MTISDLSKYEDFQNLKEIFNSKFKDKYHNIEKLIRAGNITKNRWYKINKLFDEKKRKEIYSKDNQFSEIIDFYKKLYESNPKRNSLTHNDLKQKICDIIDLVDMHKNTNEISIWPPKSEAKDYYGFSQKTIEETIRGNTLKEELANYKKLLGILCKKDDNSLLFLHTISKSVLFKKQENIMGGTDIRVINILPAWLSILEKLSLNCIKNLIKNKLKMLQFGFIEGGSCNLAKIQVWYNAYTTGTQKSLLIDIKKAFDSINRNKLRDMIEKDFSKEESKLILNFIDIYDNIETDIQGEKNIPNKRRTSRLFYSTITFLLLP